MDRLTNHRLVTSHPQRVHGNSVGAAGLLASGKKRLVHEQKIKIPPPHRYAPLEMERGLTADAWLQLGLQKKRGGQKELFGSAS